MLSEITLFLNHNEGPLLLAILMALLEGRWNIRSLLSRVKRLENLHDAQNNGPS